MGTNEIRQYLHKYIDIADARFLATIYEISLMNGNTVHNAEYFRAGKRITKQQLYKELKEAEAEIENGDCLTIEELIKESEQW
ncbi:MAG: hypothetical protein KKD31_09440 [Bacteroidetes bacterium]|nr:hypothetical protein [Bacteroidota bacterium]